LKDLPHLFEPPPTTNRGSGLSRPVASFQIELLNASVKRFNPLATSAKPKRQQ
jgi:hypothetical protein